MNMQGEDKTGNQEVDTIEMEELEETLGKTKNRKAVGTDGINPELINYGNMFFKVKFLIPFKLVVEVLPDVLKKAKFVPVFKKEDRNCCGNHRGISILNAGFKIYSRILTEQMANISDVLLLKEQAGFRMTFSLPK
jgi:hypothetical protein